jgi:hypothetical protein
LDAACVRFKDDARATTVTPGESNHVPGTPSTAATSNTHGRWVAFPGLSTPNPAQRVKTM